MSDLQNAALRQIFAVPKKLNRSLLLCRFDFRQKAWVYRLWKPIWIAIVILFSRLIPLPWLLPFSRKFPTLRWEVPNPQSPQSVGLESDRYSASLWGKTKNQP
jgi:hypothetical protein